MRPFDLDVVFEGDGDLLPSFLWSADLLLSELLVWELPLSFLWADDLVLELPLSFEVLVSLS